MGALHRVNMLRIKQCSDGMRWYRHLVGQLVPHLGWSAGDGYRSREPSGYTNFVLTQDATPTHVHVGGEALAHWPFDGGGVVRCVIDAQPQVGADAAPANLGAQAAAGQSRAHSVIETATNIVVGFTVSMGLTAVVLPAYGHDVTIAQNMGMTGIFTVASVLRSYGLRRLFNRWHNKTSLYFRRFS